MSIGQIQNSRFLNCTNGIESHSAPHLRRMLHKEKPKTLPKLEACNLFRNDLFFICKDTSLVEVEFCNFTKMIYFAGTMILINLLLISGIYKTPLGDYF